ncbi:MAG: integrase [Pseudomonadota bacterium]|nr:integrase [Pseudomonadota bacterium]
MSTMIFEVYDALKDAGATEDKARKAAEALAAYENRFNKVESDLNLLKWMVGFNLALSAGILLKMYA